MRFIAKIPGKWNFPGSQFNVPGEPTLSLNGDGQTEFTKRWPYSFAAGKNQTHGLNIRLARWHLGSLHVLTKRSDWQGIRKYNISQHSFDLDNSKYELRQVTAVTITNTRYVLDWRLRTPGLGMTIELKSLGPNRLGWFTVTYQTASPTQWCTLLWPGVGLKGETCRATERNRHHGQLTRCFFELPDSNLNDKDWQVTRKSDTSQHSFDPENSKYEFLRVTAVTITNTKDMCWTAHLYFIFQNDEKNRILSFEITLL